MSRKRCRILARGIVQGVGFRPFVYRLAVEQRLGGSVRNRGDAGVEIFVEGEADAISGFLRRLESEAPFPARVERLAVQEMEARNEVGFSILPSTETAEVGGELPADLATCDACVEEILTRSRFSGYWATSCTHCGPRFTLIESLPYDRPRTAMRDFPMCDACDAEYTDPLNRRYHAQTTACAACGPILTFDGEAFAPIKRAAAALRGGEIVAIKGLGGTHIACDATDEAAVARLRERIGRPAQPYALMAPKGGVAAFSEPDDAEWEALRSPARPIVLLRARPGNVAPSVAPGLHTVGVMLPYSGLHHLLFAHLETPLVMTSANLPGQPMLIDDEAIQTRLQGVADHLLLHNRRIVARCDDSVRRRAGGRLVFLRRSRGWVPGTLAARLGEEPILALGPETDVTFTIYADGRATVSQHIGSADQVETIAFLREAIDHLYRITRAPRPRIVACDLHPGFATTRLAEELAAQHGASVVRVQHHAAHLCAAMAEHDLDEAVGVVLDGYGYGPSGDGWGGELFVARDALVERVGSLRPVRLPGGDAAARNPLRMVASFLRAGGAADAETARALTARGMDRAEVEIVLAQIDRGLHAPWTSSAGRFLDAVAAWLGVCRERTYEGEPAMRLEATAVGGCVRPLEAAIRRDARGWTLDTADLFARLTEGSNRWPMQDVAATAQAALARGAARAAVEIAMEHRVHDVCFCGGVAYNDAIASAIRSTIEAAGLLYRTNEKVPCGDGGVSFGQAAYAGRRIKLLEADRADAATRDHRE